MNPNSQHEANLYGPQWHVIHGGYFSDPNISRPFVKVIARAIEARSPALVIDIGGGTGHLLEEVLREQFYPGVRFINVDLSGEQTSTCRHNRVESLNLNMSEITRSHFGIEQEQLMFIMRSVLHYLGEDGLRPFLKHLRGQMHRDELFLHQTACFERDIDSACLNHLYQLMKTQKWYPVTGTLNRILNEEGFIVEDICPAPILILKSADLAERYHLSDQEISSIGEEISHRFGETPEVFIRQNDGYAAYLHYEIFTCRAA
ncbi:MAG: class I SAM-dependent methyltransferase [Dehalococcoidia bacterium]|nr:MAG: class I SAM-dependent methyltransferase [Dehalococcoidia bacterium]